MNVIVTGGAGYIGAHLVRLLTESGYNPVIIDDFRGSSRDRVLGFEVVAAPLEDRAEVIAAFKHYRPRHVLHLAGYISVAESMRNPRKYWDNNLRASVNLLAAAQQYPIDTFVFSSTAAVYGESGGRPLQESDRLEPASEYGASKLAFEKRLHEFAATAGFRSVALRYFNACGCNPDWRVGEAHEPEEHLIPNVIRSVLDGLPIRLFGDDYDTPDGTCVRDYIHVMDLAEAHLAVINQPGVDRHASLNVGTGSGLSVKSVVNAVLARVRPSRPVPVSIEPRRPGDTPSLVADTSRFRSEYGWKPKWSSLEQIIDDAVRWELMLRQPAARREAS